MKLTRAAIVVVSAVLMCNGGTAVAADSQADGEPPETVFVEGQEVSPGEQVTFDQADIDAGVDQAADLPQAQQDETVDDLVEQAEEVGSYVDADSTELVSLAGGSVLTAIPAGLDLTGASLTFGDGFDSVTLGSDVVIDTDAPTVAGPGMATTRTQIAYHSWLMKYVAAGDGSVIGDTLFTRRVWRVTDSLPGVTYASYRTASGEPNPNGDVDAEVNFRGLTMTSTPKVAANLKDWVAFAPTTDVTNECDNINATIVFGGLEFGSDFPGRCNSYDMHRDGGMPGHYELRYRGNSNEKNVYMKYSILWTQVAGTALAQQEYQSMQLSFDPSFFPNDDVYLPWCKDFGVSNVTCKSN